MMRGDILIVDDNPDNLQVLEQMLAAAGHEVRAALSGETALKAIAARPPQLILLDVIMPEMDGFEVCRRLKTDPATRDIPILFVSGLAETEGKVLGFDCGGLDYITKPFAEKEVLARVKTHLLLAAAQKDLVQINSELTMEVQARISAENALRESGFRLFQIIQRLPMPTFVIDIHHVITHWNKALEKQSGMSAEEMVGTREPWRPFYPQERPTLADLVMAQASEESIAHFYDGKFRKSALIDGAYEAEDYFNEKKVDGKWYFFMAAPLTDSQGGIIGAIETLQDITERKRAEDQLRESEKKYRKLSITDSLTGLYNSRHFFKQLANEVVRANRYGVPLSLILLDVDNFKKYNDRHGHPAGDQVLKRLADVLRRNMRSTDSGYRYGGEEFTILLPETAGKNAQVVAERLRAEFAAMAFSPRSDVEIHMTVSVGVNQYLPEEPPAAFLKRVDECMYKAKRRGKNQVCDE